MQIPNEQWVIVSISAAAAIFNLASAIRAIKTALLFESGCHFACENVGVARIMHVLYGLCAVCLMLFVLKSWSIFDIMVEYWYIMPNTYHIRSFAYLGENFGVAMIAWAIISLIKKMGKCDNSRRLRELMKE